MRNTDFDEKTKPYIATLIPILTKLYLLYKKSIMPFTKI